MSRAWSLIPSTVSSIALNQCLFPSFRPASVAWVVPVITNKFRNLFALFRSIALLLVQEQIPDSYIRIWCCACPHLHHSHHAFLLCFSTASMAWVGPLIKYNFWNRLRAIFTLFRGISWLFRGIYWRRSNNRQLDSYEGTVQRLSVWGRHKLDLVLQPSGPDNFLLVHDAWVDPEYVLDDSVSLYYITKDEAVFVQCPPGVIVSSSVSGPFLRQAQYQNAQKVLIMPIHVFHKLADKVGDPTGTLVFISNTGRCGSTLLTQVFEETKRSVAFSEPDCMNSLSVVKGKVPDEEYNRIVRNSVRVLCKPCKFVPHCLCYVIKLTSPTMLYIPYLMEKFADSKTVFMYRNGLPMCKVRYIYFPVLYFASDA